MIKIVVVGELSIDESMFAKATTEEFTPEEKEMLAGMIPGGQDLFSPDSNRRKIAQLALARQYYTK